MASVIQWSGTQPTTENNNKVRIWDWSRKPTAYSATAKPRWSQSWMDTERVHALNGIILRMIKTQQSDVGNLGLPG